MLKIERNWPALFILAALTGIASGQWTPQQAPTKSRFRSVSVVSASVAWAGGNHGTYARTLDAGATWQVGVVPDAAELDFRDIHALDAEKAWLLSIGDGEKSRIYRTTDGGRSWSLQFTNTNPKAFFDCMAFWPASMPGLYASRNRTSSTTDESTASIGLSHRAKPSHRQMHRKGMSESLVSGDEVCS